MSPHTIFRKRGISIIHGFLKLILFVSLFTVFSKESIAQLPPEAINYQAILRDGETSEVLSNQNVYLYAEYLQGPGGGVVYSEEFNAVETNRFGMINLRLGTGSTVSGQFSDIPWSSGSVWLRISVDRGTGMNILQETPFSTVPYAFYAGEAANSSDGDTEDDNEIIEEISLQDDGLLTIVESGQTFTVDLSDLINDADADPENERVDSLFLDEETAMLTLYESGQASEVDLSPLLNNLNPSELIQDLELNGNTLTITQNEQASPIDLAPYLDNTDNQDLELSGTELSLTGDATPVDLSTLPGLGDDDDADPENELQALTLDGNELEITNNPAAEAIDLSPYLDNTDSQDLELSGTELSLTGDATPVDLSTLPGLGDDDDADPENELQNIQLLGDFLSLTNITPAAQVDLSPYDNSELPEGSFFIGNGSDVAEAREISGDLSIDTDGEATVSGLQSVPLSTEDPEDGEVLIYDEVSGEWIPELPEAVPTTRTLYYSVDPLDFREIASVSHGDDLDQHNVMKFYDAVAPFVMMRNVGTIRTVGAPIHLPHGAIIQNMKVYFTDNGFGSIQFRLARKDVTDYSDDNQAVLFNFSLPLSGDGIIDFPVPSNNVVDNSRFVYRLLIEFSDRVDTDTPTINQVEQRIYGAVIEYTITD